MLRNQKKDPFYHKERLKKKNWKKEKRNTPIIAFKPKNGLATT
jgi:hypothetical protein